MIADIFHYISLILYIYVTYSYKNVVNTELIYSWWALFTILMFCIAITGIEDYKKIAKNKKSANKTTENKKPKNVRLFNAYEM